MDAKQILVVNRYCAMAEDLLAEIENSPIIPGVPSKTEREHQIKLLAAALLEQYARGYSGKSLLQ